MNVAEVRSFLEHFVQDHSTTFVELSNRESALLEVGGLAAVERHYRASGYSSTMTGPNNAATSTLVVKTSTRGHPSRYSRIRLTNRQHSVELHLNAMVRGAHDAGLYCVDVGVVRAGVIPDVAQRGDKWSGIENTHLVTFGEVKRLVVYPMLLAQFVGIVHEIKPAFINGTVTPDFIANRHLPPVLMALGHFSSNSGLIVSNYRTRGVQVTIAEGFDIRLAQHRRGDRRSPLLTDEQVLASEVAALGQLAGPPARRRVRRMINVDDSS